jgi:acyl-CoA thioester hydrolase
MFEATTQIRVRYAETDLMGYVYYGNYATYYEVARVECMRQFGLVYKDLESQGVMMPILENWSKFKAPAFYDELLTIKVYIKSMPGVKIRFDYDILNEKDELIHQGYTLLAFVDVTTRKPCLAPAAMRDLLAKYFEAS